MEEYLAKIEVMGKLELHNFKEKVLKSELQRDERVTLIKAIEVRENALNNTHRIEAMAENGELKMEEL